MCLNFYILAVIFQWCLLPDLYVSADKRNSSSCLYLYLPFPFHLICAVGMCLHFTGLITVTFTCVNIVKTSILCLPVDYNS